MKVDQHILFSIFSFATLFLMLGVLGAFIISDDQSGVTRYDWRVVRVFPHDVDAFTQGLVFYNGYVYESTGRRGHSEIRKVELQTGEIIMQKPLEDHIFGEGLTIRNDTLIQLTLNSETGFVYDLHTFEIIKTFSINGEAWGLTNNSEHLIMSDGSSALRFLNPATFKEVRRIDVSENGEPVSKLNELEIIDGRIFANQLSSNEILIINPFNGKVEGSINLGKLVSREKQKKGVNVLNGIAYDSAKDRIFITGKFWPNLYEIKIRPVDNESK